MRFRSASVCNYVQKSYPNESRNIHNAFLIVIIILIVINELVAKRFFATIYIIIPEHEKTLLT